MRKTLVLHFKDSVESFSAAYAAYAALGDSVVLMEVPKESFNFKGVMAYLPAQVSADEGAVVCFSTAAESWAYFHPQHSCPPLYRCLQASNLQAPGGEAFKAWLDTQPRDLGHWQKLVALGEALVVEAIECGAAMLQYQDALHRKQMQQVKTVSVNGRRGLMLCAGSVFDDSLGWRLAEKSASFALLWAPDGDGAISCRLYAVRSYDLAALVQPFGGVCGPDEFCAFMKLANDHLSDLVKGTVISS